MTYKNCPDCGSVQTWHWSERLEARVEIYLLPIIKPLSKIQVILRPLFRKIGPKITLFFINLTAKLKLAKILIEPDEKTNYRGRCFWEEAKKRGIQMYEYRIFGLYTDSYFAKFNGKFIFFDGLPRPNSLDSESLEWLDNKSLMNAKFFKIGIPVAKSGEATKLKKALEIFRKLDKPVIVKPSLGSRSRHTTLHINNENELVNAFIKAKAICPWVTIQEELIGSVYRATLVGKKLIAVLRRDPALVEGDGIHNIKELLDLENSNPVRQGPLFHLLLADEIAETELKRQNLSWKDIPKFGQLVVLGNKTSRGVGGGIVDVSDEVDLDNKQLFEEITAVLDDPLIGIDFIITDIKKSWKIQEKCGVIECNSLPFIDLHHYPSKGKIRNVAAALWNIIFPDSEPTSHPIIV